jgi:hypothetical protein
MSTDPACRTLGEYVAELVARLGSADIDALERLRRVVGARRARITLDGDAIDVGWVSGVLQILAGPGRVDGTGATDRQTVLEMLAGELEVHDAILDGRLHVVGKINEINRMFIAIEILLDTAARAPGLQALADDFRADPCRAPRRRAARTTSSPTAESELLGRLDLLPDA